MIRVERVLVMELDDSLERLISSGAEEVEGKEQQLLAHSFCWSPSLHRRQENCWAEMSAGQEEAYGGQESQRTRSLRMWQQEEEEGGGRVPLHQGVRLINDPVNRYSKQNYSSPTDTLFDNNLQKPGNRRGKCWWRVS